MTAFAANSLLTLNYSFVQFGSVIQVTHIRNTQDTFTLSTTDGLGNQGLLAILGQVQRATDLPLQAPDGYIIEVVGEPSLQVASQFVQYDSSVNPGGIGVWVEVIKPGALTGFDNSTLPHRLQQNGNFLTNATAQALPTFPNRVSNATIYTGAWEFPPEALWPGGMIVTFSFYRGSGTATTDTFSYTVLDGDETSEAIIVALRLLINANANYTAGGASTHQLSVVTTSHTHGSLEIDPDDRVDISDRRSVALDAEDSADAECLCGLHHQERDGWFVGSDRHELQHVDPYRRPDPRWTQHVCGWRCPLGVCGGQLLHLR